MTSLPHPLASVNLDSYSFPQSLFCSSTSLTMATRGRDARINIEAALAMLDTSYSGSEFDVSDSDTSSESDLRQKNSEFENDVQHLRSDEEETGTVANSRGSPATRHDNQLDPGEGPSTSRNTCGLDCRGEPTEPGRSHSDSDRSESSSDESCTERNTTPKSRKRVRKPQSWKKEVRIRLRNSGKKYRYAPGKEVLTAYFNNHCPIKHDYTVSTLGCCPNI